MKAFRSFYDRLSYIWQGYDYFTNNHDKIFKTYAHLGFPDYCICDIDYAIECINNKSCLRCDHPSIPTINSVFRKFSVYNLLQKNPKARDSNMLFRPFDDNSKSMRLFIAEVYKYCGPPKISLL